MRSSGSCRSRSMTAMRALAVTIFHLEPNVKGGAGGLRDHHTAHCVTALMRLVTGQEITRWGLHADH